VDSSSKESGIQTKIIQAEADGECILRCTAQNNTEYDEVISDLPLQITGLGNKSLDPYTLIEAIRFTDWEKEKERPEITLESGISNRKCGNVWISFDRVDFGSDGADTIHIPIFSFSTELPIEIYEGNGVKGECLGKFTYKHESIYNTYSENIFTINRRLFGVHTITVNLLAEVYFHGFYFDKTPKAFAKLRALDANLITGDSYKITDEAVEGIGNNVNLDFNDMNFGENSATSLTVCGKSNTENNTINIKFFDSDGKSTTQVIEFSHTDKYEEKKFEIESVKGNKKISFVLLPGCNFDFKWFKFE
jgi:beta-galactosidase